jgi:hypothetical protein
LGGHSGVAEASFPSPSASSSLVSFGSFAGFVQLTADVDTFVIYLAASLGVTEGALGSA